MGRLGRAAARLVPAGRRDWAEAVWAEASEVPSGLRRLAWLAGGVQVIAREALMARRIGRWLLFAAAAAIATRVTWPGSPNGFATVIARIDVVTIVLLLAGRRYRAPGSSQQLASAKIWQGVAAGFLATGIGGLVVTVLGTGTVALMPRLAWLWHLLYPGQHLLPAAAYSHELAAAKSVGGYGLILLIFPVIGLLLGMAGGVPGDSATSPGPSPGGGGPPGPEPVPEPPDGGRLVDADRSRQAGMALAG